MDDFILEEPYRNTKQNLVKERHYYANVLTGGPRNSHKTEITFEINGQKQTYSTNCAAIWLDTVFQRVISGKPKNKIEKWILRSLGRDYLTLDEIKELVKIKVYNEFNDLKLTEC